MSCLDLFDNCMALLSCPAMWQDVATPQLARGGKATIEVPDTLRDSQVEAKLGAPPGVASPTNSTSSASASATSSSVDEAVA